MTLLVVGLWAVVMGLMVACGEDENGGNNDTLFTGLSGVVILFIVIYLVFRYVNKRRGDGT